MKTTLLILFMSFSVVVYGQEAEVKEAFAKYKTAMLGGDTDGIVANTSQRSFEYYEMLIDYALNADSAKVASLGLVDRMTVLGTRIKIPVDQLKSMDGAGYVRYGIENKMSNPEAFNSIDVGNITIEGDSKAMGQVMFGAQALPAQMTFYKESGNWKFDASSMTKLSENAILQQLAQQGISEQDFVNMSLTQVSGGQVPSNIWQPLLR